MRIKFLLYGAFALMSLPAVAQPTPDPVQSGARVPEIKHESAFEKYAPYREQPLAAWREVNDEVARVGGHIGMFGGAGHADHGQPGPAPASASKEAPGQSPARDAPAAPQPQHMGH